MKVSQSKIKTWRQCKRAYWFKYVENLRKKTKSRPLEFGTIVHEMLEAHANGDDPFEVLKSQAIMKAKMFEAEREMYGEIIDTIRIIMTEYFEVYKKDTLRYVRTAGRSGEHEFEIEVAPGIIMVGKIDGIGCDKRLRWIVEHKTFGKRLPGDDDRWRNLQSAVYIRAIDMLGWKPVDGMLWNYIWSKAPTVPEILKNGGISRRKITTLPAIIHKVIVDNGLRASDYEELIKLTEEGRSYYFSRIYTPVAKHTVSLLFNEFVESAREVAESHGVRCGPRNIGMHCGWCDFEGLCRAELQGSDVDFVKEREYVTRQEETAVEPTIVGEG